MRPEAAPTPAFVGLWLCLLAAGGWISSLVCTVTGAESWVPPLALTLAGMLLLGWDYLREGRSKRNDSWLTRL